MRNELSNTETPTVITSMMGAIYGAVKGFDDSITLPELYGLSGHGFILNIEEDLFPTGPTAWDWGAILFPLRQLYNLRRLCANCDMRSTEEAKELIWMRTIDSINAYQHVILWDAVDLEFYLCYGYDADTMEYLVKGPKADKSNNLAKADELGKRSGQVWALFPTKSDNYDKIAARDLALKGAINWYNWKNEADSHWIFGGQAWDKWINAMKTEEFAAGPSASINHFTYAECRRNAAVFLADCGGKYEKAAESYSNVADALEKICKLWALDAPVPDHNVRTQIADLLTLAKFAEKEAVKYLEDIYSK